MLRTIAGIDKIEKLYIQLLYRCNFNCQHCFHGERLAWTDSYTLQEAQDLVVAFEDYGISSVTLLGGEPFLYRDFSPLTAFIKSRGLLVEVCTNGFRIRRKLLQAKDYIDKLRVSLEGLKVTNDQIRHPGSFAEAIAALELASALGVSTAVTMTVNSLNISEVVPLAFILQDLGVEELKLHCLRDLGNVVWHNNLLIYDSAAYDALHQSIRNAEGLKLAILFDEDLDPQCSLRDGDSLPKQQELERVEVQPTGELYVSCKAVGSKSNAFF